MVFLIALVVLLLAAHKTPLAQTAQPAPARPELSIALHYGAAPPLDQLRAFDLVVVEPDHPIDPIEYRDKAAQRSQLYAYVSLGEVQASRAYFARMKPAWIIGRNPAWDSQVIDQAAPGWAEFFVDEIVRPLWNKGYRGFFFDTMDSYTLIAKDEPAVKRQQDGIVRLLKLLAERLPEARLILNRGFEFLPHERSQVQAIAAESLIGRWDAGSKTYVTVPDADRQWLLDQFNKARNEFGIQPLAIEYADPRKRESMRTVARDVMQLGFTPYVTDGDLSSLGMGPFEVVPRRILLLHEGSIDGEEDSTPAQRNLVAPLQYLGYRVDLHDYKRRPLPQGLLADRYVAVVGWIAEGDVSGKLSFPSWYQGVIDQGIKLILFNSFGAPLDAQLNKTLGVSALGKRLATPLTLSERDPMFGFEFEPVPNRSNAVPVRIDPTSNSKSLLRITDARGQVYDGAALTPWGGFVMWPYTIMRLPGTSGERWVVNLFEFLAKVLDNSDMPIPDPTTEVGRRILMTHIDGDGFPSRAETSGNPFASEVMYRDFIAQYKIPHTVSVIEAEIAPHGLHRADSPELEAIARKIFALPHVEIATHTFSHPFEWRPIVEGKTDRPYNLKVPGYQFSLKREFEGSADYINTRLAPAGKKTKLVLWSGDCVPPPEALAASYRAGLLNMNGGDTLITRKNPSQTLVSPMSIRKDGWLQVLAPNTNENNYTGLWTGPFYGFERVIETFELTDSPRRTKPINLYYHTYAASKPASIMALHKIYRYVMAQSTHPIFGSDYIRRVHEFEDLALVRDLQSARRWRVIGHQQMRTLRWRNDLVRQIDWNNSPGVLGSVPASDGSYLHLTESSDWFAVKADAGEPAVRVVSANGVIDQFVRRPDGASFKFRANVPGELLLAHKSDCKVTTNQRIISARDRKSSEITLKSGANGLSYQVPEASTRDGVVVSVRC